MDLIISGYCYCAYLRGKVHTIYTPSGFGWIGKAGYMGISSGNDSMFLVGIDEVKVIRTCTENPHFHNIWFSYKESLISNCEHQIIIMPDHALISNFPLRIILHTSKQ